MPTKIVRRKCLICNHALPRGSRSDKQTCGKDCQTTLYLLRKSLAKVYDFRGFSEDQNVTIELKSMTIKPMTLAEIELKPMTIKSMTLAPPERDIEIKTPQSESKAYDFISNSGNNPTDDDVTVTARPGFRIVLREGKWVEVPALTDEEKAERKAKQEAYRKNRRASGKRKRRYS